MFLRPFGNHSPIGTVTSQKIEISGHLFNLDNCKQTSHSHIQYNPNTNNMQTIKIALCTIKLPILFDPSRHHVQGGKQMVKISTKISIGISF
jgi:hypothetical protein